MSVRPSRGGCARAAFIAAFASVAGAGCASTTPTRHGETVLVDEREIGTSLTSLGGYVFQAADTWAESREAGAVHRLAGIRRSAPPTDHTIVLHTAEYADFVVVKRFTIDADIDGARVHEVWFMPTLEWPAFACGFVVGLFTFPCFGPTMLLWGALSGKPMAYWTTSLFICALFSCAAPVTIPSASGSFVQQYEVRTAVERFIAARLDETVPVAHPARAYATPSSSSAATAAERTDVRAPDPRTFDVTRADAPANAAPSSPISAPSSSIAPPPAPQRF